MPKSPTKSSTFPPGALVFVEFLQQACEYSIHSRFGHLRASAIQPRLQLAALYAATSSLLPEPGSNMKGAQLAMQMLRQSWSSQPLSKQDVQHLHAAAALAGHLAPALRLLAAELEASACLLQHLHAAGDTSTPSQTASTTTPTSCQASADAASEYKLQALQVLPGGWTLNPRLCLTPDEEAKLLGTSSLAKGAFKSPDWRKLPGMFTPVDASVPECPVAAGFVQECEQQLQRLVSGPARQPQQHKKPAMQSWLSTMQGKPTAPSCPAYPLTVGGGSGSSTPLEEMQQDDLRSSWQAYHSLRVPTEVDVKAGRTIVAMQVGVVVRCLCESCVLPS